MRVLSLSHRLQHRMVDNHSIFNAPNIFDYDAIVVDAGGVFETIRVAASAGEAFKTFADIPVANGEPIDGSTGIAEVLRRRREEFVRAFERGATVALFLHPQAQVTDVVGLPGLDRYYYLPAPPGVAWDASTIRGSEGTAGATVDHEHPFAPVFDVLRQDLLYRAYIDERAPGIAGHARVFARSAGGAAIGLEVPVLNGRLVVLPTPRQVGAKWLVTPESHAIIDAMRASMGQADDDRPRWAAETPIPGLPERQREADRVRASAARAQAELDVAEGSVAELDSIRDVLWREGDAGLLPAVVRCAELLGFKRGQTPEGDPVLVSDEGELQLVVAGATEAVDMAPHYRLRQRLDHLLDSRAHAGRGLVVVNGQRLQRPDARKREYTDSLRVAAESVGYAVLPSSWLFDAAVMALEDLADDTKAAIRRRLLETDGVVEFEDLLGFAETEDAGTATDASDEPAEDVAEAGEPTETEVTAESRPTN
ncbi:MAG: hypothetical protein GEU80_06755 [Dehalococcoidia bacterium]|nr:hypothetical protein [Dehalococcoidia bacterium]